MNPQNLLLVGCGILHKEVRFLIAKNGWPLDTALMASALHSDLERLERGLRGALAKHRRRRPIVFYGCCHPRMDEILEEAGTLRTEGQNCVEMVLGKELFTEELLNGAFFLFEDWALDWDRVSRITFGDHPEIMREILQGDRRYLLGLRTPCSGDFAAAAERVAYATGLPLRWMGVGLDHLEVVLRDAIERRQEGCR